MPWFTVEFQRTVEVAVFSTDEKTAKAAAEYESMNPGRAVDVDGDWFCDVRRAGEQRPRGFSEDESFAAVRDANGRAKLEYFSDAKDAEAKALASDPELLANIECKRRHGLPVWTDEALLPKPADDLRMVGAAAVGLPVRPAP
jgi:hypothetical protein